MKSSVQAAVHLALVSFKNDTRQNESQKTMIADATFDVFGVLALANQQLQRLGM